MLLSYAFFFLPMAYFYYEAIGDIEHTTQRQRCCEAFKYSMGCVIIFAILFVKFFLLKF